MSHANSIKQLKRSGGRLPVWTTGYVATIALINAAYAHLPPIPVLCASLPPAVLLAGAVFVLRDLSQKEVGHGALLAMIAATALSYQLASPEVALASAASFAVAEIVDYLVFSLTRWPLSKRILISSAVSVPIDTVLFFTAIGITDLASLATGIGAKMVAAIFTWSVVRVREARA